MELYLERKEAIEKRLEEFSQKRNKEEIFYELCFCVLTPQSNGIRCWEAIEELERKNFFKNSVSLVPILAQKTRFHHTKAKHLLLLKKDYNKVYERFMQLEKLALRNYLVENVKGIGWKEASHFLRNVGHRDLAILDRHILRKLVEYKVIIELPKKLDKKEYFAIEEKFKQFSRNIGISMDALDLYFWSLPTGKIFK